MEKLKAILKKPWIYPVLLIVSLLVVVLLNEAFKYGANGKGYTTSWNAEDALSFYGDYLSFFGTVVLGVVAFLQNERANQLNSQMQKLQQAQFVSMVSVERLNINRVNVSASDFVNTSMRSVEKIDLTSENFEGNMRYLVDIEFFKALCQ